MSTCNLFNTFKKINQIKNENLKTTFLSLNDDYSYSGSTINDRTHMLRFSIKSMIALYKSIKKDASSYELGNEIFHYLTVSWAKQPNWHKYYGSWFTLNMKSYNDYESVHSLFNQTNSHTWKNGFIVKNFVKLLDLDIKSYTSIIIYVYVDFVFLGHNLYGTKWY